MTKLRTLSVFALTLVSTFSFAQTELKDVESKPKEGIHLKIRSAEGTNGSAVTWHPDYENYYTIIAGNADYPMEVFDKNGRNLQSITPEEDLRGLWYNPDYDMLEGNTYDVHDIVSYLIDESGELSLEGPVVEIYELYLDEPQAVIAYDPDMGEYVWYDHDNHTLNFLDMENGEDVGSLELDGDIVEDDMNYTTVIYTGITGGEYGLLNYKEKKVYLIADGSGDISKTISLPKSAITHNAFRFSYANGHIWLYDADNREWIGYKIIG